MKKSRRVAYGPSCRCEVQPETVEELTAAQRNASALKKRIPEFELGLDRFQKKNKLNRSFGTGVDTTAVEARWSEFVLPTPATPYRRDQKSAFGGGENVWSKALLCSRRLTSVT